MKNLSFLYLGSMNFVQTIKQVRTNTITVDCRHAKNVKYNKTLLYSSKLERENPYRF